nr:ribonuclease H-like domain-containing protein [Tanacetum cinerariifolium]
TKDETSDILKRFITEIEKLKDLKVKIIRVLVYKSQNKTPYELFNGKTPDIGFLKPFACHVMILNTLNNLGKFEAKRDEGTNATNILGIKDAASQEVETDVSFLRYIVLPNWVHDALLESSSSKPQDDCSTDVPKNSGNSNPTSTSTNPPVDQLETLTVETPIPTVGSPVPTASFTDSLEPSNEPNGVETDVSNMKTTITASPTPTLRIHKDHPKSQIIGPVDTPIQTRNKSKELGEQSFIATIHQKTNPTLLQAPAIGFLKLFGCHVMILNTLDNLWKFEAKGDECYFIGYSMSSKAFRVFNKRTRRVEENLHVEFLENKAIEQGAGPNWLFDIDSLTKSMNYVPVDAGTNSTNLSGTKDAANQEVKKNESLRYIVLPNWAHDALLESNSMASPISTVSLPVPTACLNDFLEPSSEARLILKRVANQEETPSLDNILSLTNRFDDILG